MDYCNIYTNKNSVTGDKSALVPGGIRLGSPAMTSRGLKEDDFTKIVEFLDRGINLTLKIKTECVKGKKIIDF